MACMAAAAIVLAAMSVGYWRAARSMVTSSAFLVVPLCMTSWICLPASARAFFTFNTGAEGKGDEGGKGLTFM